MEIQKIPAEKLKAAKYNPRKDLKPGDPEYEKLRRSIEEFGYVELYYPKGAPYTGKNQAILFMFLLDVILQH